MQDKVIVITGASAGIGAAIARQLSALHGGQDSRAMPGAQTADEVAAVVLAAIRERHVDVYTAPSYAGMVRSYFDDMDAFERASPFAKPRP